MFWIEIRQSIERSFTTKERKSENSRLEKKWRTKYRARFFKRFGDRAVRGGEEGSPPRKPNLALFLSSTPPGTTSFFRRGDQSTTIDAVSVHEQREAGRPQTQGFGPASEGEHR
jgi:hypothetical protein